MFQLDLKSRKSIYEQVVDNLKEMIISGVLKSGEKLPSVRELSRTLTVNPNTVQKAYRELERQGYVYTSSGLGTFAADQTDASADPQKVEEVMDRIRSEIAELFYLGVTSAEIRRMFEEALKEKEGWK
ncbi:GntR family transcriptional regulator [Anaerovorax odorimutans]|uniref:GntR family transcriptional regulator n=1 Tax=Anaerovorax odorimutans TaxID=109327 RepID=A0ABT1RJ90_9FIRM|nr:GntR family transcriptional regulator [Anaerovorax odorimutans]MCQ4635245.1 GntR family transcriptional regulator [Anaerovorax odorimutans]